MQRPSMRRLVSRRSFFLAPPRGRPLRDLSATSLVISGLHAAASRKRGSSRGRKRWLALRKGVGKHLRRPSLAWATRASADVEAPAVTARLLSFSIGLRKGGVRARGDLAPPGTDVNLRLTSLCLTSVLALAARSGCPSRGRFSAPSPLRVSQASDFVNSRKKVSVPDLPGKRGLLRSWALARIAVISGVGAPLVSC